MHGNMTNFIQYLKTRPSIDQIEQRILALRAGFTSAKGVMAQIEMQNEWEMLEAVVEWAKIPGVSQTADAKWIGRWTDEQWRLALDAIHDRNPGSGPYLQTHLHDLQRSIALAVAFAGPDRQVQVSAASHGYFQSTHDAGSIKMMERAFKSLGL